MVLQDYKQYTQLIFPRLLRRSSSDTSLKSTTRNHCATPAHCSKQCFANVAVHVTNDNDWYGGLFQTSLYYAFIWSGNFMLITWNPFGLR
jgi:hypothetical protein